MAIPPTNDPTAGGPPAPPIPGQRLRRIVWSGVILLLFMFLSLPTVLLLFFGMLPSIVAWMVDRSEQKYAMFCVSGMNFLGLFPFLTDVWFHDHSTDMAIRILTNVFDLMAMYAAAGFGWLLFIAVPPVVTTFLKVMSERRVTLLRATQKEVIEEWGEAVATMLEDAQAEMEEVQDSGAAPPA